MSEPWPSRDEFRRMEASEVNRFFESVGVDWRVRDDATGRKSYPEFLDHMGHLLRLQLPALDRERGLLDVAEAEVHRLKMQLATAEERQAVLRERYSRERLVMREMFDTWRSEMEKGSATAQPSVLADTGHEAYCPAGFMVPEGPCACSADPSLLPHDT